MIREVGVIIDVKAMEILLVLVMVFIRRWEYLVICVIERCYIKNRSLHNVLNQDNIPSMGRKGEEKGERRQRR